MLYKHLNSEEPDENEPLTTLWDNVLVMRMIQFILKFEARIPEKEQILTPKILQDKKKTVMKKLMKYANRVVKKCVTVPYHQFEFVTSNYANYIGEPLDVTYDYEENEVEIEEEEEVEKKDEEKPKEGEAEKKEEEVENKEEEAPTESKEAEAETQEE
jgi:hypothetical protein